MSRINTLNTIIEEILGEREIDSLLEKAVSRITGILEAQRVTFYFFNTEIKELWSYAVSDLEISEIRIALGQGIAGACALKKKIVNIKDAYDCPFFNKRVDKQTGFRTKAVLCAPLLNSDQKLIGVVQAINKKNGSFNDYDEQIIKSLSLYLVIALENIRLLQEQETLFRSTLYALVGAIDAKDPTTAGHSYRVAYFSGFFLKRIKDH
jgi:GAF domain-containing protein